LVGIQSKEFRLQRCRSAASIAVRSTATTWITEQLGIHKNIAWELLSSTVLGLELDWREPERIDIDPSLQSFALSTSRLAGGCSGNPVVRDPLRARSRSS